MTDKTMLNFRCPADLLDAIDAIGQQRYPSDTAKHGCDRTKTLLDIVRAGIEALSDGTVVLQASGSGARQRKTKVVSPAEELPGKFERPSADEIEAALVSTEDAKNEAKIYGFTPDEALADAYFQLNMLTSNYDELEGRHETLKRELEKAYQELKNTQPAIELELPEPADALNHLKAIRKKSRADLGDIEALWEIIEEFRHNPAD